MSRAAPAGMMVLPLALFAGSLALVATAGRAPADDGRARVELELAGVLPMPDAPAGILVLREKGTDTILPLLVADGRPFAPHGARGDAGLLGRTIEALGGRVAEVEIERAEESSSGARVRLAQGGKDVELRAVPSESIALALAAGVPIVTTRRLLDEQGLTPEDLARAHAAVAGDEQPLRL
jgi:hypothetical protein